MVPSVDWTLLRKVSELDERSMETSQTNAKRTKKTQNIKELWNNVERCTHVHEVTEEE